MITEAQARTILTLLTVEYPEFYRNLSNMEVKLHIARICKDYEEMEFPQVYAAYEACVRKCKFPPKTADIFEFLQSQTCHKKLEPAEARKAILKAVSNGIYNADDEFKKLPDELKEVMTVYDIKEMAVFTTRDLKFQIDSILKQLAERQQLNADYELLTTKGKALFSNASTAMLETK